MHTKVTLEPKTPRFLAWLAAMPRVLIIVFAAALASASAFGQSTHGSILGVVTDSSKAVIPGVSVTITNTGTNISKTVLSGEEGNYEAANLPPGTYRVKAELPGFKTFIREGIALESRAALRVDVLLEVGEQTSEVRVTAATPVIETEGAQIADVRDAKQLNELPSVSNGEVLPYVMTAPGVQSVSRKNHQYARQVGTPGWLAQHEHRAAN